jgi:hypothetical protein
VRKTPHSVYDADEYYSENESGSRLSPAFDWLLRIFDRARVRAVLKNTGLSAGKFWTSVREMENSSIS